MDRREQIKWFKTHIDIREYLLHKGYKIDKSRDSVRFRAFISADGQEKLVVPINDRYPVPSYYFNQLDQQDKGSIIDFVASREQKNLAEVCETLAAFQPEGGLLAAAESHHPSKTAAEKKASHQFVIQKIMMRTTLEDPAYLLSRAIDKQVLEDPIFKNRVFNNTYQDMVFTVFPFYNDQQEAKGLWMKNDHQMRFIGERDRTLWSSNLPEGPVERLIINESPEESLAHRSLKRRVREAGHDFYLAVGGNITLSQITLIQQLVAEIKPLTVVVAMNNDAAGGKYKSQLVHSLPAGRLEVETPQFNDFNGDLVAATHYAVAERHLSENLRVAVEMPPAMKQAFNVGDVAKLNQLVEQEPRLRQSQGIFTLDQQLYVFSMRQIAEINKKEKVLQWVDNLGL